MQIVEVKMTGLEVFMKIIDRNSIVCIMEIS